MTLVGLFIVLVLAVVIIWAAATYLPIPLNYIVIGFVIVALLILLLNSVGGGAGVRVH